MIVFLDIVLGIAALLAWSVMLYNPCFKRFWDIVLSLIALVVLSPVMMVLTVLGAIKMKGNPFFTQERPGKEEKIFKLIKFRSMTCEKDKEGNLLPDEVRLTGYGKKLRSTSLDELPELINVLKGDMSFVGPRPDVPGYADKLEGDNKRILELKPGITGPASLKYRNEEEILAKQEKPQEYNDNIIYPDKIKINLYYLDHYSFFTDLKIILCTVFGRRMRYGEEVI